MKAIITIDPGAGGGIAWREPDGSVEVKPMPDSMTGLIDELRSLRAYFEIGLVIVEKTGTYREGNSGPASVKFARHCGHIEAALYALGIPTEQVAPSVWQKALGTWPKDKMERKRAIRDEMARRFPGLSVTLKTADALGILVWGMGRKG